MGGGGGGMAPQPRIVTAITEGESADSNALTAKNCAGFVGCKKTNTEF